MSRTKYFIRIFIAIIISAICYFFSTGFYDIWFLAWIAPVPVLIFSLCERKIPVIFLMAFLAYFLGGLNILYYATTILPIIYFILSLLTSAIIFAVIVVINSLIIKDHKRWWSVFAFPCLLVAFEYLVSCFSSAGAADSLAYTQLKFLPAIQIAAITGIWGITFTLGLFSSAITIIWYLRKNKRQVLYGFFIPFILIGVILSFGVIRLNTVRPIGQVKVGLLSTPLTMHELFTINPKTAEEIVLRYLGQIPELKRQGVAMVLMPEEIVITKLGYHSKILSLFQKSAKENKVMLVFGMRELGKDKPKNTTYAITDDGKIAVQYYKHHLVPATEGGFYVGTKIETFSLNHYLFGISICKDNDFIYPDLEYSRKGIGALLVPAWDFGVDRWLHAKPSFMRGIEGGYSVIRAAQDGYLSVTDQCGRILAIKATSFSNSASLIVDVPIHTGKSIYSLLGNWLVWTSIAGIFILILMLFIFR